MVQKKEKLQKQTLTSAAVGAAVGVGLGAAAVALSNKSTRKAIVKKTAAVKKQAENLLPKGKSELNKATKKVQASGNGAAKTTKPTTSTKKKITSTKQSKTAKKA